MPGIARKPQKPWTGVHRELPSRERRSGKDRRHAEGAVGQERRRSPGRRHSDLPRRAWPGLGLAALAGIAAAAGLQSFGGTSSVAPAAAASPQARPAGERELARQAGRLRDDAEALTPAEVALDEHATERWLLRLPALSRTVIDPRTPGAVRREAAATLAALARAGIRGPRT